MNGMPNVPTPPSPESLANMVMQDVNAGINWALQPINFGLGWANQMVSFATSWPGRAMSAVKIGGM